MHYKERYSRTSEPRSELRTDLVTQITNSVIDRGFSDIATRISREIILLFIEDENMKAIEDNGYLVIKSADLLTEVRFSIGSYPFSKYQEAFNQSIPYQECTKEHLKNNQYLKTLKQLWVESLMDEIELAIIDMLTNIKDVKIVIE